MDLHQSIQSIMSKSHKFSLIITQPEPPKPVLTAPRWSAPPPLTRFYQGMLILMPQFLVVIAEDPHGAILKVQARIAPKLSPSKPKLWHCTGQYNQQFMRNGATSSSKVIPRSAMKLFLPMVLVLPRPSPILSPKFEIQLCVLCLVISFGSVKATTLLLIPQLSLPLLPMSLAFQFGQSSAFSNRCL